MATRKKTETTATESKDRARRALRILTDERKGYAGIAISIDCKQKMSDSCIHGPSDLVMLAAEELLIRLYTKYQPSPRFLGYMAGVMLGELGSTMEDIAKSVDAGKANKGNA